MASIQYRDGKWLARVRKAGFRSTSKILATKSKATAQEHKIETGVAGLPDNTTTLADLLSRYQQTITIHKKSQRDESRRIDCILTGSRSRDWRGDARDASRRGSMRPSWKPCLALFHLLKAGSRHCPWHCHAAVRNSEFRLGQCLP